MLPTALLTGCRFFPYTIYIHEMFYRKEPNTTITVNDTIVDYDTVLPTKLRINSLQPDAKPMVDAEASSMKRRERFGRERHWGHVEASFHLVRAATPPNPLLFADSRYRVLVFQLRLRCMDRSLERRKNSCVSS